MNYVPLQKLDRSKDRATQDPDHDYVCEVEESEESNRFVDSLQFPRRRRLRPAWPALNGLAVYSAWRANKTTDTEETKALFTRDKSIRITQCLVHIAALLSTAALITLNLRQVWYSDVDDVGHNSLQGLQFAAKVYELIVEASLAAVMVSLTRKALCSQKGLTLGGLVAAYQFGHASSISSPTFWASLPSTRGQMSLHRIGLPILLIVTTLLATSAGPVAAIALVPSLGYWSQPLRMEREILSSELKSMPRGAFYVNATSSDLWPSSLNKSHLMFQDSQWITRDCTNTSVSSVAPQCPAAAYAGILSSLEYAVTSNGKFAINQTVTNVLESSTGYLPVSSPFERYLTAVTASFSSDDVGTNSELINNETTVWKVPHLEIAGDLQILSAAMESLDSAPVFRVENAAEPVVQIQCSSSTYDNTSRLEFPHDQLQTPPLYGDTNIYSGLSLSANVSQIVDMVTLRERMSIGPSNLFGTNSTYFTWVDLRQQNPEATYVPSIGMAMFVPYCEPTGEPSSVITCSVDARWFRDTLITGTEEELTTTVRNEFYIDIWAINKDATLPAIKIGLDWAEALNTAEDYAPMSKMESLLKLSPNCMNASGIVGIDYWNSDRGLPYFDTSYQMVLGAYMVDALSRVGVQGKLQLYPGPIAGELWTDVPAVPDIPLEDLLRFPYTVSRYGYSYGIRSLTDRLALAVLFCHGLIALVALILLCFDSRLSNSWNSLGDLLVLALNSAPPDGLRNTGAGIARLDTWRSTTAVRALHHDDGAPEQLQMVFSLDEHDHSYTMPDSGKKYA